MAMARSRHITTSARGFLGRISASTYMVTERAHVVGFSVSSNMAREFAHEIALAASMGWISIVQLDGKKALRYWNITHEGLVALQHRDEH